MLLFCSNLKKEPSNSSFIDVFYKSHRKYRFGRFIFKIKRQILFFNTSFLYDGHVKLFLSVRWNYLNLKRTYYVTRYLSTIIVNVFEEMFEKLSQIIECNWFCLYAVTRPFKWTVWRSSRVGGMIQNLMTEWGRVEWGLEIRFFVWRRKWNFYILWLKRLLLD